ncbi:MAG: 50S ribosomal protein L11 methyltransferase [Candidatus Omnitrophica bacterium]|nr:50S ribosomal protein L11 methyltransferase [Candidatus Omnitrophota bacterium]
MLFEIQLKIPSVDSAKIEIVKQLLVSAGIPKDSLVELRMKGVCCLSVYVNSKLQAGKLAQKCRDLKLKGVAVSSKALCKTDWQDTWKETFKTFALTKNIDIVPAWLAKSYTKGSRIPVYIDTSLAFGTGLHETTKFMAQLIEEKKGTFDSFLDIGTGTGILAIIAGKFGAAQIKAIDIDKEAVKIARSNLKLNGCKVQELKVEDIANMHVAIKYDFVAANLITQDLLRFQKKLCALVRPRKYLAISGISLENLKKVQAAFKELPLQCLKIIRGREWAALLYQRGDK